MFYNLVATGKLLDLKNSDPFLKPLNSCDVHFFDRDVAIDEPGNVLYGMIRYLFGVDRWGEDTIPFLAAAAGAAQEGISFDAALSGAAVIFIGNWGYFARHDPMCDAWVVKLGSEAVETYGSGITEEQLALLLG